MHKGSNIKLRKLYDTKLTWKFHVLSIESKQQLEMKNKQRGSAKAKGTEAKQPRN